MAFGNIVFGGAVGVVVDTSSGAAYDYPNLILVRMGTNPVVSIPGAGGTGHAQASLPAATSVKDPPATRHLQPRREGKYRAGVATVCRNKVPLASSPATHNNYGYAVPSSTVQAQ
ncbi:hypothetical protein B0G57_107233 [Trinickia symbiotica]|nr:hypothetical protein B0G57_107233 [Trinickia symbiotica]